MRTIILLIMGCFFIQTLHISIPLTRNMDRCMIVYTSTPDENLILDMKFPAVPNQDSSEYYRVTIHNTEDKSSTEEQVISGTFRKQLDLVQSVVYKVCFAFITERPINTIVVEYNAETKFSQQIQTVKVPQTLLKSEDFKNTYSFAENMHMLTSTTIQFQKERREREDAIYNENKKYIDLLFWISIFEIGVICLTGVYQFFSVRNFLITKQYL